MEKNQKIAFYLSSDGWGGLEMNVLKLQNWLMATGYDIRLFCCKGTRIQQMAEKANMPFEIIQKPGKKFDFLNALRISKVLKRHDIKLAFLFQNSDMDVFSLAKRLFCKNIYLIYQQHMQIGINKKDPVHTFRYLAMDRWISPLQWLKDEVGQRTKYPLERLRVIPLGVDTEPYLNSVYTKSQAREKIDLHPKVPLIGIMGRISPKKGQGFVIKAIEYLNLLGFHSELLIVGSATVNDALCQAYDYEIREYVKKRKLENIVHFRDHMDDAMEFYNAIDIFVLASHGETYGMVTIEAMLSGLPVVGTNSGGTPEILENGDLGYLFEFDNLESFCDVIKQLLLYPEDARQKAMQARKKAMQLYDYKLELKLLDEMLKNISIP